jgi:hypothetical protein
MTNAKFSPIWNISRSPSGMKLQRSTKALTAISKKSMQHALGGRLWLSEQHWHDCKNRAPIPCEKNAAPRFNRVNIGKVQKTASVGINGRKG